MSEPRPLTDTHHDLEHADGSRTLIWVRRGRIRLAIIGSAAVLAAGTPAAYTTSGDDQSGPPAADQSSISE